MARRVSSVPCVLGLLLVSGCCAATSAVKKSDAHVAVGEIRQMNASGEEIWMDQLLMGGRNHRAGVLMPGTFSHMGFAQIATDDQIKLVFNTYLDGKELPPQTVYFDSSKLKGVAAQIRYMKFTYTGGGKWILQLYDRSETDEGYREGQYLQEVLSQQQPMRRGLTRL